MTISRYSHNNQPIPIIGRMANNRSMVHLHYLHSSYVHQKLLWPLKLH